MHVPEGPMSTAQTNALVVALIYERAGESSFSSRTFARTFARPGSLP